MAKPKPNHHDLFVQLPNVVWHALRADADATGASVTNRVTEILRAHYGVPKEKMPKPSRLGRRPKKKRKPTP